MNLTSSDILSFLKKLIFSNLCISCKELLNPSEKLLCRKCKSEFIEMHQVDLVNHLKVNDQIDEAYAGWEFDGAVQNLIHGLKYNDQAFIGKYLGNKLGVKLIKILKPGSILIPVPLYHSKLRSRGYNQSIWIAKGLSQSLRMNVDNKILKRIKNTTTQTKLSSEERIKNVSTAFMCVHDLQIENVIIVDDVMTTGSTLSACAKALKKCGAKSVTAVTLATPKLPS